MAASFVINLRVEEYQRKYALRVVSYQLNVLNITPKYNVLESKSSVIINGESQQFDQPPVLINSRTMIPLRAIFIALDSNGETIMILIRQGYVELLVRVDFSLVNIIYIKDGEMLSYWEGPIIIVPSLGIMGCVPGSYVHLGEGR